MDLLNLQPLKFVEGTEDTEEIKRINNLGNATVDEVKKFIEDEKAKAEKIKEGANGTGDQSNVSNPSIRPEKIKPVIPGFGKKEAEQPKPKPKPQEETSGDLIDDGLGLEFLWDATDRLDEDALRETIKKVVEDALNDPAVSSMDDDKKSEEIAKRIYDAINPVLENKITEGDEEFTSTVDLISQTLNQLNQQAPQNGTALAPFTIVQAATSIAASISPAVALQEGMARLGLILNQEGLQKIVEGISQGKTNEERANLIADSIDGLMNLGSDMKKLLADQVKETLETLDQAGTVNPNEVAQQVAQDIFPALVVKLLMDFLGQVMGPAVQEAVLQALNASHQNGTTLDNLNHTMIQTLLNAANPFLQNPLTSDNISSGVQGQIAEILQKFLNGDLNGVDAAQAITAIFVPVAALFGAADLVHQIQTLAPKASENSSSGNTSSSSTTPEPSGSSDSQATGNNPSEGNPSDSTQATDSSLSEGNPGSSSSQGTNDAIADVLKDLGNNEELKNALTSLLGVISTYQGNISAGTRGNLNQIQQNINNFISAFDNVVKNLEKIMQSYSGSSVTTVSGSTTETSNNTQIPNVVTSTVQQPLAAPGTLLGSLGNEEFLNAEVESSVNDRAPPQPVRGISSNQLGFASALKNLIRLFSIAEIDSPSNTNRLLQVLFDMFGLSMDPTFGGAIIGSSTPQIVPSALESNGEMERPVDTALDALKQKIENIKQGGTPNASNKISDGQVSELEDTLRDFFGENGALHQDSDAFVKIVNFLGAGLVTNLKSIVQELDATCGSCMVQQFLRMADGTSTNAQRSRLLNALDAFEHAGIQVSQLTPEEVKRLNEMQNNLSVANSFSTDRALPASELRSLFQTVVASQMPQAATSPVAPNANQPASPFSVSSFWQNTPTVASVPAVQHHGTLPTEIDHSEVQDRPIHLNIPTGVEGQSLNNFSLTPEMLQHLVDILGLSRQDLEQLISELLQALALRGNIDIRDLINPETLVSFLQTNFPQLFQNARQEGQLALLLNPDAIKDKADKIAAQLGLNSNDTQLLNRILFLLGLAQLLTPQAFSGSAEAEALIRQLLDMLGGENHFGASQMNALVSRLLSVMAENESSTEAENIRRKIEELWNQVKTIRNEIVRRSENGEDSTSPALSALEAEARRLENEAQELVLQLEELGWRIHRNAEGQVVLTVAPSAETSNTRHEAQTLLESKNVSSQDEISTEEAMTNISKSLIETLNDETLAFDERAQKLQGLLNEIKSLRDKTQGQDTPQQLLNDLDKIANKILRWASENQKISEAAHAVYDALDQLQGEANLTDARNDLELAKKEQGQIKLEVDKLLSEFSDQQTVSVIEKLRDQVNADIAAAEELLALLASPSTQEEKTSLIDNEMDQLLEGIFELGRLMGNLLNDAKQVSAEERSGKLQEAQEKLGDLKAAIQALEAKKLSEEVQKILANEKKNIAQYEAYLAAERVDAALENMVKASNLEEAQKQLEIAKEAQNQLKNSIDNFHRAAEESDQSILSQLSELLDGAHLAVAVIEEQAEKMALESAKSEEPVNKKSEVKSTVTPSETQKIKVEEMPQPEEWEEPVPQNNEDYIRGAVRRAAAAVRQGKSVPTMEIAPELLQAAMDEAKKVGMPHLPLVMDSGWWPLVNRIYDRATEVNFDSDLEANPGQNETFDTSFYGGEGSAPTRLELTRRQIRELADLLVPSLAKERRERENTEREARKKTFAKDPSKTLADWFPNSRQEKFVNRHGQEFFTTTGESVGTGEAEAVAILDAQGNVVLHVQARMLANHHHEVLFWLRDAGQPLKMEIDENGVPVKTDISSTLSGLWQHLKFVPAQDGTLHIVYYSEERGIGFLVSSKDGKAQVAKIDILDNAERLQALEELRAAVLELKKAARKAEGQYQMAKGTSEESDAEKERNEAQQEFQKEGKKLLVILKGDKKTKVQGLLTEIRKRRDSSDDILQKELDKIRSFQIQDEIYELEQSRVDKLQNLAVGLEAKDRRLYAIRQALLGEKVDQWGDKAGKDLEEEYKPLQGAATQGSENGLASYQDDHDPLDEFLSSVQMEELKKLQATQDFVGRGGLKELKDMDDLGKLMRAAQLGDAVQTETFLRAILLALKANGLNKLKKEIYKIFDSGNEFKNDKELIQAIFQTIEIARPLLADNQSLTRAPPGAGEANEKLNQLRRTLRRSLEFKAALARENKTLINKLQADGKIPTDTEEFDSDTLYKLLVASSLTMLTFSKEPREKAQDDVGNEGFLYRGIQLLEGAALIQGYTAGISTAQGKTAILALRNAVKAHTGAPVLMLLTTEDFVYDQLYRDMISFYAAFGGIDAVGADRKKQDKEALRDFVFKYNYQSPVPKVVYLSAEDAYFTFLEDKMERNKILPKESILTIDEMDNLMTSMHYVEAKSGAELGKKHIKALRAILAAAAQLIHLDTGLDIKTESKTRFQELASKYQKELSGVQGAHYFQREDNTSAQAGKFVRTTDAFERLVPELYKEFQMNGELSGALDDLLKLMGKDKRDELAASDHESVSSSQVFGHLLKRSLQMLLTRTLDKDVAFQISKDEKGEPRYLHSRQIYEIFTVNTDGRVSRQRESDFGAT